MIVDLAGDREAMITKEELVKALDDAVSLIEDRGWGWGSRYQRENKDSLCMGEAICETSNRAYHFVARRFSVVNWNDTPGRTKEEVVEKLREWKTDILSGNDNID